MSDTIDTAKLQRFVEAALTNPDHPVYRAGLYRSPILQNYATNVVLLGAVSGAEWFKQHPAYTTKLDEVMTLCEAEGKTGDEVPDEIAALKAEIAELKAKLNTKPEAETDDEDEDDEEAPESREA